MLSDRAMYAAYTPSFFKKFGCKSITASAILGTLGLVLNCSTDNPSTRSMGTVLIIIAVMFLAAGGMSCAIGREQEQQKRNHIPTHFTIKIQ